MQVKFEYIKFKNVNSFGNKQTLVNFKIGLTGIFGKNGQGKSTIIDALSFNLFGQPYRKIKIGELINRTNKGNLWTESKFMINNNVFIIERGLQPNILKIVKNGEELDLLSSKKLVQEEIDKILGLNHDLFKQIICLAVNYNKPYLAMSQNEKRNVIESIFNIDIFGVMLREIKKRQGVLKTQSTINTKQLNTLENTISISRKQIKDIQRAIDNFEAEKNKETKSITQDISKYSEILNDLNLFILKNSQLLSTLKKNDLSEVNSSLKVVNDKIAVLKYKLKSLNDNITTLNSNTECSICGTPLNDKHVIEHISEISSKLELGKLDLESSLQIKNELLQDLEKYCSENDKINSLTSEIDKANLKIGSVKSTLANLQNSLQISSGRQLDLNVDSIKADFSLYTEQYKELFSQNSELNKTVKNNDVLLNILSDDGIKSHFFKKLIPIVNTRINFYLDKFELPVFVKFDEFMNETISSRIFSDISYMTFSEGEKKRIDLAIQFAFFDTARTVSNWQSNIFFIDELLDSGVDSDGMDKVMTALKELTHSTSELCVYLISHKLHDESFFDNKMTIEKHLNFSNIIETNI